MGYLSAQLTPMCLNQEIDGATGQLISFNFDSHISYISHHNAYLTEQHVRRVRFQSNGLEFSEEERTMSYVLTRSLRDFKNGEPMISDPQFMEL